MGKAMKEETRTHLLGSSDNGGWDCEQREDEDGKGPTSSSSSSITLMLLVTAFFAVLGSLASGFSLGFTSPVQSEIMQELGLSTSEFSLFGSIFNIGAAVSALTCGKMADYLGRRRALQFADLLSMLGWFAIAIGKCPVYLAEFTPKDLRGGFVLLHALMLTIGGSLVYIIGLVTYWRTLALIGIIPSLVQFIGLFFVPESPRWLMMIGRDEEFKAALQRIRGGANVDIAQEATYMRKDAETLQQMSKVSLIELFQRKYAYVLTVGIGLGALSSLVGMNGVVFYARSTFESAGFSGTVGTVTLAVVQDLHLLQGISPFFVLIGILIYAGAYPIGMGGVSAVITSEIYPINIKGLAGSLGAVISCLCGWVVSYAFNFMMDWSSSGTFFVLACICAFALVFAAKLVPETKGRTLEEVHSSISHIWQKV